MPEASAARAWLGGVVRTARSVVGGSALVLMYHRVITTEDDPYDLAVAPDVFDAHMAALSAGFDIIPATALCEMIARRRRIPTRSVVVTFDDGYHDLLAYAKPILERHRIPATAFVSTGEIGTSRERWWDELAFLEGEHRDPARYALLRTLDAPAREAALDALAAGLGRERPARAGNRTLTAAEVVELAQGGLVEIGAHTVSHGALAALDPGRQRAEIEGSKTALEGLLGREVTLFSYPFGGPDAVSESTRAIVAETGFVGAFTTDFGLSFPWTGRFAIPRCSMSALGAEEFSAQLDQWFALGR
ncbi:MAG: hypothetical protein D9V44_00910 [Actinobacteria bacterium]|nr:MAG: hypothetical protein D9V44_00910 [Actinomycetota bacterium]